MVPKFRAWYTPFKGKKFGQEMIHGRAGSLISHAEMSPDNYVLMQSTGLKDKNGVEIFEGDVVSLTEGECSYSGIVVRDYYEFYIKGIGPRDCFDFQDVSNTFDGTTSLEVTTNIYKNPELLEQANE